jgi:hypothetical protein
LEAATPGFWYYDAEQTGRGLQDKYRCHGRYNTGLCRARDLSAGRFRIYIQFKRFQVYCRGAAACA